MATTIITATATVRVRGANSPATVSAVARVLGEALSGVLQGAGTVAVAPDLERDDV